MTPEYHNQLEADIDRELKGLPELQAPPTLALRVMAAIEQRAALPWYRKSWQLWPMPIRLAFGVASLALVAAVCYGLWVLPQTGGFTTATHYLASCFSWVAVLWNVVTAILTSLVLAAKGLGTGFLVGCVLLFAFAWALCLGLGTAYFRLAYARR
jgi:hypothetical protein